VPSHNVVTELKDAVALEHAARQAAQQLGYTRMWSIHPDQVRPILRAFSPSSAEVHTAAEIIDQAAACDWAPLKHEGRLHDRASFRLYWQCLVRAHQTGQPLPDSAQRWFH
jgi:citrate lyase subunit beta/citryl-CoA lyase